jgi:tRNA(fMet)-specific endonuclease VapC
MTVLGEVIGGILYGDSHEASWKKAKPMLMSLVLWPFDASAAQEYGRLFAGLKSIGRPMQQIDIQIAAIALALGNCTVITYDSDLAAVPGLAFENWRA